MRRNVQKTRYPGIFRVVGGYWIRLRVRDARTGKLRELNRVLEGATLPEAQKQLMALRDAAKEAPRHAASGKTLTVFARSWFRERLVDWEQATRERYLVALEQHILPFMGGLVVEEVRRSDVLGWRSQMTNRTTPSGSKYKATTINGWMRVLIEMLKDAVAEFNLDHDPTLRVKALTEAERPEEDPNCLTAPEVGRFLKTFKEKRPTYFPIVALGLFSGLRWGELSALSWSAIREVTDGQGAVQHVVVVARAQYRGKFKSPKSRSSRTVPLAPELVAILEEHREAMKKASQPVGPDDLVFPSRTKKCRWASTMTKPFREVQEAMGMTVRFTPHGMRRTYNNLLRQASEDGVLVRSIIGHVDERMTARYSVLGMQEKQRVAQQVYDTVDRAAADTGRPPAPAKVPEGVNEKEVVFQVVYTAAAA